MVPSSPSRVARLEMWGKAAVPRRKRASSVTAQVSTLRRISFSLRLARSIAASIIFCRGWWPPHNWAAWPYSPASTCPRTLSRRPSMFRRKPSHRV